MNFNVRRTELMLGHFQNALVEALKVQWDGNLLWPEHLDVSFISAAEQEQWNSMDCMTQAFWLLKQLRASTAVVPGYICALADVPCGSTYAKLAEKLERDLRSFENEAGTAGPSFTEDCQ
ncbi:MAG: hypothetical protein LAO08_03510 [Acidobacteriia bacterium]|nr:hypothetical protein [Terriglobia bacterium]